MKASQCQRHVYMFDHARLYGTRASFKMSCQYCDKWMLVEFNAEKLWEAGVLDVIEDSEWEDGV